MVLQSAVENIENPVKKEKVEAKIVLGIGSQRSYTNKKKRRRLKFARSTELKNYDLLAINRMLSSINIPVKALDVSCLCSRIQGQRISLNTENYSNLCQLEFINDDESDDEIGVRILSLDHYWDIVTGNNIRENQRSAALETKLEYVLPGPVHSITSRAVATFFTNTSIKRVKSTVSCTSFGH